MNLYKSLFEADPVAAADDEDDDKKKSKPVADKKKASPFDFLNDLGDEIGGTSNLPSEPIKSLDNDEKIGAAPSGETPAMPAADPEDTRRRAGAITPNDQMRDMLNRIDQTQDDEIDDAEAARRAGLAGEQPRPQTPNTAVDRVRPAEVPVILNRQLRAAGTQMPEWHTINNLPGYMQRAIRGMGRQMFSMMTRTPLEQIMTIANVGGQGPNTDAEMRAVAAWLQANGQDLGPVDISHGQAIPGYEPDVREFSAMGLRFHVVRDPMGQYIYAYPERDARIGGNQAQLPGRAAPALGRPMPRLNRESNMKKSNKPTVLENFQQHLTESFARYKAKNLYEEQTLVKLANHLLKESTLSKLIGAAPSGQSLVRWMHARHLLSNTAEYESHPFNERVMWTEFKNHPDQFMLISGSRGVAGIKPNKADIDKGEARAAAKNQEYNPARDNTLRYQIVAFRDNEQVDPALLRNPADVERDADPTVMKARGGMVNKRDTRNEFNIFDSLADQIGTLQSVYISTSRVTGLGKRDVKGFVKGYEPGGGAAAGMAGQAGGVEREKIKARTAGAEKPKQSINVMKDAFKQKLKPIIKPLFKRVGNLAMMDVRDEAQDAMQAGAFQRAQNWMNAAKKIESLLIAINKQGELNMSGYGNPISDIIDASLNAAADAERIPLADYIEMVTSTPGTDALKSFMTALKANLIKNTQ